VDSTNNYAASSLKLSEVVEGTVVMAYEQTAGRGQRGNYWFSGAGLNLTFTVILRPSFLQPSSQFVLNQMVSVALINYLKSIGIEAVIKWPNDILVDEQKIAGILIENVLRGEMIESSAVGIGLNVNQDVFPVDLKASSILRETGLQRNLSKELDVILRELETAYQLLKEQPKVLKRSYIHHLYGFGAPLFYRENGVVYQAVIEEIGEQGELMLRKQDGSLQSKLFKEVQLLGKNGL
jgi:BirA family transcriptional regulator, biotin operon repressor / biotin---[acetyl-CoA-carboxylase] ligase